MTSPEPSAADAAARPVSAARVLGVVAIAAALATLLIWIPLDVASDVIERVRRRSVIGDALAPTVAAALLGLAGVVLVLETRRSPGSSRGSNPGTGALRREHLAFLGRLIAIFAVSVLIVRYAGPATVGAAQALGADLPEYRLLRATIPWAWIGYVIGGGAMVGALVGLAENRLSVRGFAFGFAVALGLALLIDLPFEDLLLPPNGDVG